MWAVNQNTLKDIRLKEGTLIVMHIKVNAGSVSHFFAFHLERVVQLDMNLHVLEKCFPIVMALQVDDREVIVGKEYICCIH